VSAVYALVISNNKRAREQFIFDMARFSLTIVIMLVGIFLNAYEMASDRVNTLLLFACVVQELYIWIHSRMFFRAKYVPFCTVRHCSVY
jgi:hypothetical protein